MTRSLEDLKALIMAADEYRENVSVDFMGEQFVVPIRPLTEGELIDVSRQMKLSMKMLTKVRDKLKVGDKLTKEEEETVKAAAVEEILKDDSINIGDLAYTSYLSDKAYCMKGVADPQLRDMVTKFRYGLTEQLSKRIQNISNVPPEAIQNFFGPKTAKPS